MSTAALRDPDEILLGFARALRAAGVPVTQDRAHGFLEAVALVGLDDARATYVAGRATLCASPDDLARYDQVHEAYFNSRDGLPRPKPAEESAPTFAGMPLAEGEGRRQRQHRRAGGAGDGQRHRGAAPPRRRHAVGGREEPAWPR